MRPNGLTSRRQIVLRLSTPRRNEICRGIGAVAVAHGGLLRTLQLLDVESRGGVTAAGRRTGEDARVGQRDGGEVEVFE
jgi:hypothetical protein